jgi:ubiquinone/menaquinone biosynthesis C-methylase UbiE
VSPQAQHARFTGSIPAFYDRYLGPVIFEPYARDLAHRVPATSGVRVIETACGTGIVTRRILERLPADGTLAATDLNPDMLEHAQTALGTDRRVEWRAADAQQLPFADAAFDAMVMQFGMMFVPDPMKALREARRVLVPGGRFVFNVWDSFARNPFGRITHEVAASVFPENPPAFYLTPFGDPDPEAHVSRARSAGFADVTFEGVAFEGVSPAAEDFAAGLIRGNPILLEIAARGTVAADEVERRLAEAFRRELGDRPVRTPLHAWVITAITPR